MDYKKITDKELENVGVIGLGDTPELSTQEMQAKFEETVRSVVIPAFNRLVESLEERDNISCTKDEMGLAVGRTSLAIAAVTDVALALALAPVPLLEQELAPVASQQRQVRAFSSSALRHLRIKLELCLRVASVNSCTRLVALS